MKSKNYFSELNYSLGNEDTGFEVELLKTLKPRKILSIAGCGSRLWPLAACGPDELVGIDIAIQQIHLCELRLECIKKLEFEDYLIFWGFPPFGAYDYSHKRRMLYERLELSAACRLYFDALFAKCQFSSPLYLGKWEQTFKILSKMVRFLLGSEYDQLFKFTSLSEQVNYYHSDFPMKKWKGLIFLLGNKSVFNALLYKGNFIKKNVPESHFDYYYENFERLFSSNLARESFFAHLCFYGELQHPDGNTIEATEEVFLSMKENLTHKTKIELLGIDLMSAAQRFIDHDFDFLSLSDVPSYFSGETEVLFLQKLKLCMKEGGVAVVRSYLREPELDSSDFVDITPQFGHLVAKEKVQMYRIKIYRKN